MVRLAVLVVACCRLFCNPTTCSFVGVFVRFGCSCRFSFFLWSFVSSVLTLKLRYAGVCISKTPCFRCRGTVSDTHTHTGKRKHTLTHTHTYSQRNIQKHTRNAHTHSARPGRGRGRIGQCRIACGQAFGVVGRIPHAETRSHRSSTTTTTNTDSNTGADTGTRLNSTITHAYTAWTSSASATAIWYVRVLLLLLLFIVFVLGAVVP